MEELTLENIAPYLPYGLKVKRGTKDIYKIQGADNSSVYYLDNAGFSIENCKPILHPMDLTKPITIEGKEVIPIVELAKIGWDEKLTSYHIHPERACLVTNWKSLMYPDARYISFNCKTWENNNFYLGVLDSEINEIYYLSPRNQKTLFKWLYANKFDVDGLIDAGLAIDVNTLETNPY